MANRSSVVRVLEGDWNTLSSPDRASSLADDITGDVTLSSLGDDVTFPLDEDPVGGGDAV
jgi:hypothetical protein